MESRHSSSSHDKATKRNSLEPVRISSAGKSTQVQKNFHSREKIDGGNMDKETVKEEFRTNLRALETTLKVLEDNLVVPSSPSTSKERKISTEKKRLSFLSSKIASRRSSFSSKTESPKLTAIRPSVSSTIESYAYFKPKQPLDSPVAPTASHLANYQPSPPSTKALPHTPRSLDKSIGLNDREFRSKSAVSNSSTTVEYLEFKLCDGRLIEDIQEVTQSALTLEEQNNRTDSILKIHEQTEEKRGGHHSRQSAYYSAFCFPEGDDWSGRFIDCLEGTVSNGVFKSVSHNELLPPTCDFHKISGSNGGDNPRPPSSFVEYESTNLASGTSSLQCDDAKNFTYHTDSKTRIGDQIFLMPPVSSQRNFSVRHLGSVLGDHPALRPPITIEHSSQFYNSVAGVPQNSFSLTEKPLRSPKREKQKEVECNCAHRTFRKSEASSKEENPSTGLHGSSNPDDLEKVQFIYRTTRISESPVKSWRDPIKHSRCTDLISEQVRSSYDWAASLHQHFRCKRDTNFTTARRRKSKSSKSFASCSSQLSVACYDAVDCPSSEPPLMLPKKSFEKLAIESDISRKSSPQLQERNPIVSTQNLPSGTVKLPFPPNSNRSSPRTSVEQSQSTLLMRGNLQCESRDGTSVYNFWMEHSEQVLVARTQKTELSKNGKDADQSISFNIYSLNGKAQGKSSWKGWGGRKDKPALIINSTLIVKHSIISEVDTNGRLLQFLDSEFVLLKQDMRDSTESLNPRASFSSWDAAGSESPFLSHKSASCPGSPKRNAFSQDTLCSESPSEFADWKTRHAGYRLATRSTKRSLLQTAIKNQVHQLISRRTEKDPEQHDSDGSSSKIEGEVELSSQANGELAAMVIRAPIERKRSVSSLGGYSTSNVQWSSWSAKFSKQGNDFPNSDKNLKASSKFSAKGQEKVVGRVHKGISTSKPRQALLTRSPSMTRSLFDGHTYTYETLEQTLMDDLETNNQETDKKLLFHGTEATMTVILPAGKHGCPTYGFSGPQPLIDRWRSGGTCDCGSWDLGCGLVVLDNHHIQTNSGKNDRNNNGTYGDDQAYNKLLEMHVQGKKQDVPAFSLTTMSEGLFSVDFKAPFSSLQAFATAVAVLHSRAKPRGLPSTREGTREGKRKPPRAPSHATGMANSPLSVPVVDIIPAWRNSFRSRELYSNGRHLDPPVSPIERV
ncbi:hypothetical protein O6H91_17G025200 [Diphasiastrum complanatum]|uniref:Uncharacterized protein n=3 Tax=Diphasiastrum complanatum TaxID=34168 RepID=A0ACC2B625_DIPCM|nr:hypothetical protein O6H91_17G025200 [Diphasiastrum complanatum]KAJ7524866.1 hypothetical protein O6H91_17G025200 [Diphasiastrum complanatum]KAJ7524867.1 hypothetical protein O6H91_17G025200 [Diphasiastrum complanatum]